MNWDRRVLRGVCAAIVAMLWPASAPGAFSFTKIVEVTPSGAFPSFGVATINNSNVVGFSSAPDQYATTIYKGDGGPLTTVYSETASNVDITGACINNLGVVAFVSFGPGSYGAMLSGSGGAVTTLVDTNGPLNSVIGSTRKFFNDAGMASFYGGYDSGGTVTAQFRYNGDGTTTNLLDSTSPQIQNLGGNSSINAFGVVAFFTRRDDSSFGIYTTDGNTLKLIADNNSGAFSLVSNFPSINNDGVVAFQGTPVGGASGIFTGDGSTITNVADVSGPFLSMGSTPCLNNAGTVAFFASLDAGGSGIFTGSDPVDDKVVRTGDALYGSTISSLSLKSINDLGNIAFGYTLASGRTGVAVAVIPEPFGVVIIPLLCASLRRRRVTCVRAR